MKQFNFGSLGFGGTLEGYRGRQSDAESVYRDSTKAKNEALVNAIKGVGKGIGDSLSTIGATLEQQKRWDAEQERQQYERDYRERRDAIADARYDEELRRRNLEERRAADERNRQMMELAKRKEELKNFDFRRGFYNTPEGRMYFSNMMNASDLASFDRSLQGFENSAANRRNWGLQNREREEADRTNEMEKYLTGLQSNMVTSGYNVEDLPLDKNGKVPAQWKDGASNMLAAVNEQIKDIKVKGYQDPSVNAWMQKLLKAKRLLENGLTPNPVPSWDIF